MASSDGLEGRIHLIRGQRVMLDSDLAQLYGVATKRLNEQVRRNSRRFPGDFAFQLSLEEADILKSQFATSSWGGRRKLPMAFTEHGAVMLANVLNSKTAVEASVLVVRAFIRLRSILGSHAELARKVQELESRYDAQFRVVFDAIRELMEETEPQDKIGFRPT
ncbi:MAG TPA: ORF6N domain-containing protein [Planctomycetota bacterium]